MIVRHDVDTFLLITQPDHAQLAETLVSAIRTEASLAGPARRTILLATREHDNGWIEVDALPMVDPATGHPCDFMSGAAPLKHELWLRGVARAAKADALAGALIAEHAVTVHGYRRNDPAWASFFSTIASMRDALLQRIGFTERDAFDAYYRCVRLGDLFSLQFCNGWTEPSIAFGYEAVMEGTSLLITPDPFGGETVKLRVVGRRIPAHKYQDDAHVRAAIAAATPEIVAGTARGM